jgi:20S proteasome alpha/beta subunit
MTFIIGFRCCDGIVLCTDSLEADGVTKRFVNKTKIIGTSAWGIAIAGAGPGGFIDKFTAEVSATLSRGEYNRKQIEATIEDTLSHFRSQYQEPFRILVGVQSPQEYLLYRSDDNYLSPIKDHAHVGMGHSLWRFLSENLYVVGNSVEDNVRLGIFIMHQALQHVDGVDGDIRVVTHTFGDDSWKFMRWADVFVTNPHWRAGDIKTSLKNWWKFGNPPSRSEQVAKYGAVRTPGDELTLLDGVKIEDLVTDAGLNRVSNSLWSNRDRLRKRAQLEREREQQRQGEGSNQ